VTLVLTCLTPEYVVQVSDKRVTRISDGAVVDDLRNKGTMYCAQMGFGYTGLAEIEGFPTDRWLAQALASQPTLETAVQGIVGLADTAFASVPLQPTLKRHAFVGAGFCRPTQGAALRACQITISNFLSSDGEWLSEARPTFELEGILRRDDRPFTLCRPVGASVPASILAELKRNIRACVEHGTSPLEVIGLLAGAVRRVASFTGTVGKALLCLYVPREAVEKSPVLFLTPLAPTGLDKMDTAIFLHLPEDSPNPLWELPNFVCQGMLSSGVFQQAVPDERVEAPDAVASLNAPRYRAFLLTSPVVEHWAEFVRSMGIRVEWIGMLDRDLSMLSRVGITTPRQIETLLVAAQSWAAKAMGEYYADNFGEAVSEGKVSLDRNGIVSDVLVLTYPDIFTPAILLTEYHWALAEPLVDCGMRHNPRFGSNGGTNHAQPSAE
jgi:hypothetical protein